MRLMTFIVKVSLRRLLSKSTEVWCFFRARVVFLCVLSIVCNALFPYIWQIHPYLKRIKKKNFPYYNGTPWRGLIPYFLTTKCIKRKITLCVYSKRLKVFNVSNEKLPYVCIQRVSRCSSKGVCKLLGHCSVPYNVMNTFRFSIIFIFYYFHFVP